MRLCLLQSVRPTLRQLTRGQDGQARPGRSAGGILGNDMVDRHGPSSQPCVWARRNAHTKADAVLASVVAPPWLGQQGVSEQQRLAV